ncbi:Uncharacterised protein [Porphyromonas crevioricanis]|uniref:Uncharacterized protein n=2 Tax=Porphyromonas crevioricanis TaxID=393921 RepID=A0A2X4PHI8_9PORP|nr:Uncharacterised protein [Porphyromonas crevioricanis]
MQITYLCFALMQTRHLHILKNKATSVRIRVIYLGLLLLCSVLQLSAQREDNRGQINVSLLIASPITEEVYTLYGHVGLRIQKPDTDEDLVYNWGLFDFHTPGFLRRFVYGQTDYMVGVSEASEYMSHYLCRGSDLTELALDMDSLAIFRLEQSLTENMKPENRVYRYNFFYDNCSTRPVDMIEQAMGGELHIPPADSLTLRQLINEAERPMPWLILGTDLAVAAPADQKVSLRTQVFLPTKVAEFLPLSEIRYADKPAVSLVKAKQVYHSPYKDPDIETVPFDSPVLFSFGIALLTTLLVVVAMRPCSSRFRCLVNIYSAFILLVSGLLGSVLFFLSFISEHPAMWPNANLLFFHPFHLFVGLPLLFWGKNGFLSRFYPIAALGAVIIYFPTALLLPQRINTVFVGIIIAIASVSIYQTWLSKNR